MSSTDNMNVDAPKQASSSPPPKKTNKPGQYKGKKQKNSPKASEGPTPRTQIKKQIRNYTRLLRKVMSLAFL